ncbi:MAG: hypothetical protein ACFE8P_12100, partial [Promethearchaeota archaeon]
EATLLAVRRGVLEQSIQDFDSKTFMKVCITMEDFNISINKIIESADRAKKSYQEKLKEPVENIYG